MVDLFIQYLVELYKDVPSDVYEGLVSILCLGSVIIVVFCNYNNVWNKVSRILLVGYVVLTYCSTIICRPFSECQMYNFTPFWSYIAIQQEGRDDLITDNVMNIVVFLPIGLLLGMAFAKIKLWMIILVGLCISLSIETMQLLFHRGFSELDDIIHNTIGCLIGFGLCKMVKLFTVRLLKVCRCQGKVNTIC